MTAKPSDLIKHTVTAVIVEQDPGFSITRKQLLLKLLGE